MKRHFLIAILFASIPSAARCEQRQADCVVELDGAKLVDGQCAFSMFQDGSIRLETLDATAVVNVDQYAATAGIKSFNAGGSQQTIGVVSKNGACWQNLRARICAWKLGQQRVFMSPPPVPIRTAPRSSYAPAVTPQPPNNVAPPQQTFAQQQSEAAAGKLILGGDQFWAVLASRPNIDDAIAVAQHYRAAKPIVVRSANGWFAVISGPHSIERGMGRQFLDSLIMDDGVPKDAFLAKGASFIETVWTTHPASPEIPSSPSVAVAPSYQTSQLAPAPATTPTPEPGVGESVKPQQSNAASPQTDNGLVSGDGPARPAAVAPKAEPAWVTLFVLAAVLLGLRFYSNGKLSNSQIALGGNNQRVVVIQSGSPGLMAGAMSCIFAVLGIFTLGSIFVPIAAICCLIGLIKGGLNFCISGIFVSLLGGFLTVVGLMSSPVLLTILGIGAIALGSHP